MAGSTGLEPATSGVTGQRSNQLNYDPARELHERQPTIAQLTTNNKTACHTPKTGPAQAKLAVKRAGLPAVARRPRSRRRAKAGGRYRFRTCDSRRVNPVLYH